MEKTGKIMSILGGLLLLLAFSAYGGDKEDKAQAQDKKPAAEEGAGTISAAEVVDKLQSFYNATKDFQADFEQIYKHKIYNEEKKSSGKVFIQRPGKMRWEYKKPEKKLFVADGTTIWIYEEGINQVTKQALGESDLPVAITFLVGKGKLKDEFTSKIVPHEKFSSKGKLVLELTPKKPSPQYKKLLFIVGKTDVQVERTIIIDEAGNTNTMRFKNVLINKGIDPKKFQFKPPKGATIIEP